MIRFNKLFFLGVLAVFLAGTAAPSVVYAQTKKSEIKRQKKSPPVENSLIRSSKRQQKPFNRNYRQDAARDAMRSGRIVSLSVIRRQVRQSFPGKIVDVRLQEPNRPNRPYIYVVKVLRKDGKLLFLNVNGTTAKIMSVKGSR